MKYITLVLSITLLGIATAWAGKPEMGSFTGDYDFCPGEPDNRPIYDCGGGFFVCEFIDYDIAYAAFSDNNGELTRYVERGKAEGGFYELGNPDNFLPYRVANSTFEYDVAKDLSSFTGPTGIVVVPGQGVIFQDVGRITAEGFGVFPPFTSEAGKHNWFHAFWFAEGFEAVCDYLTSD